MNTSHYPTQDINPDNYSNYSQYFEIVYSCKFFSIGKNGTFELRILITRVRDSLERDSFNLGFGVWDEIRQDIDDKIETKNDDMRPILATVASKALEFLEIFPNAELYAEGSTPARTRLYQRELANVMELIPLGLRIEGLIRSGSSGFVDFKRGVNFEAFLLSAK